MLTHSISLSGGEAFLRGDSGLTVLLVKATIILVAAVALTRLMHRASAGARHLVWLVALGALLLVPALAAWAPLELRVLPPAATTASAAASRAPAPSTVTSAVPSVVSVAVPRVAATAPASVMTSSARSGIRDRLARMSWAWGVPLIAGLWAAIALIVVASLSWSTLAARRIVRRAHVLEAEPWRAALLEVADRLGLERPPRLLVSRDTWMPFACGVTAPTIVLPEACAAWSADRRSAVLLHELAHVRRNDLLGHLLARLVCAVYWFHPLVWMAAKRLRAESERACDDLALACGTRPTDYAEHLLDIVSSARRSATPVVALAMARRKEFEGRMLAILDPELEHAAPGRRQSAALMAALALSAGLVAAATPVVRPSPAILATSQSHILEATDRSAQTSSSVRVELAPRAVPRQAPTKSPAELPADSYRVVAAGTAASFADAVPHAPGTPDDRPALLAKVLQTDSSAELRRIAAWGLKEYASAAVANDALVQAVRHDADASVREMAAWSLAEYEDAPAVTGALGAALRGDASERVRATAAWALGTIGAASAIDALVAALSDTNTDVRSRAAWALGQIAPKQAPPALVAMLRDRDPDTRRLAAWALYEIRDSTTLPALQAALHAESDEETRIADLRAIAAMGEQSVAAISSLLESPDAKIRTMAVRALAGGEAAGPWPWPWPEPRPFP